MARALTLYAGSNAIIGGRKRVAGLNLWATDTDLSIGSGVRHAETRGSRLPRAVAT